METEWLLPDLADPTANEFWFGCARVFSRRITSTITAHPTRSSHALPR